MPGASRAEDTRTTAARRVKRLYLQNSEDPQYRRNMFGEGTPEAKYEKGPIVPQQKIYEAWQLVDEADRRAKKK